MNYCDKCGHKLEDQSNYCPGCGCELFRKSNTEISQHENSQTNNLGEQIYKFGRVKKIFIHKYGFRLRNKKRDYYKLWSDIEKIVYRWDKTSLPGTYTNKFVLQFEMCDGTKIIEKWHRVDYAIPTTSFGIKKLLLKISSMGVEVEDGGWAMFD